MNTTEPAVYFDRDKPPFRINLSNFVYKKIKNKNEKIIRGESEEDRSLPFPSRDIP